MYDIPKDNSDLKWNERINIANTLYADIKNIGIDVSLVSYIATYANNADLPDICSVNGNEILLNEVMKNSDIVIALTEFSATAPLHRFAKEYGIRAASMPGFNKDMLDALNLDFNDVAKKVGLIHDLLLETDEINIIFKVNGKEHSLLTDIRYRKPREDGGNCRTPGLVINLPSGEAFIVPYEGENNDIGKSRTNGELPIQFKDEVIIYTVEENNVVASSKQNDELMDRINFDKAVGNIAEVAFGVLGTYGIKGCGKVLLDEKLGLHIALGRSEHLGGITNPGKFKQKENVWHQDYVYVKEMQPDILVKSVFFKLRDGSEKIIITDDMYEVI